MRSCPLHLPVLHDLLLILASSRLGVKVFPEPVTRSRQAAKTQSYANARREDFRPCLEGRVTSLALRVFSILPHERGMRFWPPHLPLYPFLPIILASSRLGVRGFPDQAPRGGRSAKTLGNANARMMDFDLCPCGTAAPRLLCGLLLIAVASPHLGVKVFPELATRSRQAAKTQSYAKAHREDFD